MKENESVDSFTTKLTSIVNKAASLGLTYEDSVVVRKLLNVVPDKFLQIVATIEQYSDLEEMSVEEAIGRLKTFEERLKSKKEIPVDSHESLMFTRHEGQGKPFRERGRFNQSRGREQDKNNYQSKREERASFEEDTRDKSQVTWSAEITESAGTAGNAEIVESAETTGNAEDSRECRKFQNSINVIVSVKGSKNEDQVDLCETTAQESKILKIENRRSSS
ncbi:hypothetical protein Tco_0843614 [Tanacetum coccineum]|uniref:Zinc finger, CCHC-type n=1 Tax=Tanacetum coccineum TaxID=301880 RepID=A0ABQ5B4S6_9ASTR